MIGDLTVRFDNPGKSTAHLDFHQESSYYPNIRNYNKSLLIWFPLHDMTVGDGGLTYISGSHRQGKLNVKFLNEKKNLKRKPKYRGFKKNQKKIKVFTGNFGDVLACNFNLFHSSTLNESNKFRISAAFRVFSSEAKNFIPFKKQIV